MTKIVVAGLIYFITLNVVYAEYYPALVYQVYGSPAVTSDKAAIDEVMENLWSAWSEQDATTVAELHTIDTEWTNAFGRTYRGAQELGEFLKNDLFPAFDSEVSVKESESYVPISRRYIGTDAAVVTGRIESNRGSAVGSSNRKIGFTFVLTKAQGEWKISNQVITDLRERR